MGAAPGDMEPTGAATKAALGVGAAERTGVLTATGDAATWVCAMVCAHGKGGEACTEGKRTAVFARPLDTGKGIEAGVACFMVLVTGVAAK